MRSAIIPLTADLAPAVAAFNQRLAGHRVSWQFPEQPEPDWLPPGEDAPAYQEFFVSVEGDVVRGAYCLKRHEALVQGQSHAVASFHLPLSEGTIDPRYSLVATHLMRDAVRRAPLLYGVGMRGPQTPLARLLRALGWRLAPVPFYCKILHGTRFARQIRYLRRRPGMAPLLDLAAVTGLAGAATVAARALLTRRAGPPYDATRADAFGSWADGVWEAARGAYSFCAVRDAAVLNRVYPPGSPGLVRVRVARGGADIGWAAVQHVTVSDHEHFGDLELGTLVDAFAAPEHARTVIAAATRTLEGLGSDVIVSNNQHPAWRAALRAAGFIRGPSTVMLGVAPRLTRLIEGSDPRFERVLVTRGDGVGPWGVSRGLA
jgi:hypothetical protein